MATAIPTPTSRGHRLGWELITFANVTASPSIKAYPAGLLTFMTGV